MERSQGTDVPRGAKAECRLGAVQKRAYAPPRLWSFGRIKELTRGSGTGGHDGSRPHKF
jgi:hypothetical protein